MLGICDDRLEEEVNVWLMLDDLMARVWDFCS